MIVTAETGAEVEAATAEDADPSPDQDQDRDPSLLVATGTEEMVEGIGVIATEVVIGTEIVAETGEAIVLVAEEETVETGVMTEDATLQPARVGMGTETATVMEAKKMTAREELTRKEDPRIATTKPVMTGQTQKR